MTSFALSLPTVVTPKAKSASRTGRRGENEDEQQKKEEETCGVSCMINIRAITHCNLGTLSD